MTSDLADAGPAIQQLVLFHYESGEIEVWKNIPGYRGLYQVSNLGRIRKMDARTKYLAPYETHKGYLAVGLWEHGHKTWCFVHRLVMLAFVGPSDLGVNHKDGDKTNNRLANLEYATPKENALHATRMGLLATKLTPKDVREIRRRAAAGEPTAAIAERFDICKRHVRKIARRGCWQHVK